MAGSVAPEGGNMKKPFFSCCAGLAFLLAQAAAQDTALETERQARARKALAMRVEYAASADYDPYSSGLSDIFKKAVKLLEEQKPQEAADEAEKGLEKYRLNIDLLMLQSAAYRRMGLGDKAEQVRRQWFALMDSIMNSGDGRGFATAYVVVTVAEEYSVLRLLGLKAVGQSLGANEGSSFDIITVNDQETGAEAKVYFNIDLIKKWLDKSFEPKK
jgi:hypothetical protein